MKIEDDLAILPSHDTVTLGLSPIQCTNLHSIFHNSIFIKMSAMFSVIGVC